jgi:hypothetical protein
MGALVRDVVNMWAEGVPGQPTIKGWCGLRISAPRAGRGVKRGAADERDDDHEHHVRRTQAKGAKGKAPVAHLLGLPELFVCGPT